jgi:hypothetical protein
MFRNTLTTKDRQQVGRTVLLGLALLFLGACASAPPLGPLTVHDTLPAGAAKGYIEVFCTDCLTTFSVFQVQDGKEVFVANFVTGQSTSAAVQTTGSQTRLKRLRIAQPPGDHEYVLNAISPGFREPSLRFAASTAENSLTPIRVEFIRHTSKSLGWKPIVAAPLSLTVPEALDSLTAALSAPDWGTRWYAAEVLIMSGQQIESDTAFAQRLHELSGEDGYKQCLEHEDVFACSLVREQATRAIKEIKGSSP